MALAKLLGGLLVLAAALPGAAATLHVSAVIRPRVVVPVAQRADGLRITADDVSRGYVDREVALPVQGDRGLAARLELWIDAGSGPVAQVQVDGAEGPAPQGPGGPALHTIRWSGTPRAAVPVRFFLRPGVAPGTYPWPLRIGALP